jgi:SAM-dependent methyltransferase
MGEMMGLSDGPGREGNGYTAWQQAAGLGAINSAARDGFDRAFLSVPFDEQLLECDTNAIVPYLRDFIPLDGPILEAGSGSGRWVEWLHREGRQAIGLDWSPQVSAVAAVHSSQGHFLAGDMRAIPLCDESVAGIVSLGAIEHSIEGPEAALSEYFRVLRPGGTAVITVPNFSVFRRRVSPVRAPKRWLKESPTIRRFAGKPVGERSLREARAATPRPWHADFTHAEEGWSFYQYQMDQTQLQEVITSAGFEVVKVFGIDDDQGLWHTIGSAVGHWAGKPSTLRLNTFGRALRRVLPYAQICHMVGCVAVRHPDGSAAASHVVAGPSRR